MLSFDDVAKFLFTKVFDFTRKRVHFGPQCVLSNFVRKDSFKDLVNITKKTQDSKFYVQ